MLMNLNRSQTLRQLLGFMLLGASSSVMAAGAIEMYKSPYCGCCSAWAQHMESMGFEVNSHAINDINAKKQQLGIPAQLASCHTAMIDGYRIEGHVPAREVQRLLDERPNISGLAVPGMPHGSPGMETGREEAYTVYAFDLKHRTLAPYQRYPSE